MKKHSRIQAFSLAELLLGMALFALLVTSVASFSIDAVRAVRNSSTKVFAAQQIQTMTNGIYYVKDRLWGNILLTTDQGPWHLENNAGAYEIVTGPVSDATGVSTEISTTFAQRDSEGNIVESGGAIDLHTRKLTILAQWTDFLGIHNSVSTSTYVTDWNVLRYEQSTENEFDVGSFSATVSTNTAGGEVTMETIAFADWCNPTLTMTNHNISGTWFTNVMGASLGNAVLGSGSGYSGETFINLNIEHSDPPVVSVLGVLMSSHIANEIAKDSEYVFVGTDTDNAEVIIAQVSTTPYTIVGTFDAPGTANANGIAVSGNVGLVSTGSTLYLFDISSKTGARTQLSSVALGGNATKIFVRGNYAYITLSGNSTREMVIVDITNSSAPQLTGIVNVPSNNGVSVYVNEAGTRAYLVTFAIFNAYNFNVIDVSTKSGTRSYISRYSTGGTIPIDVVAPENSKRAIVVGLLGSEQYQVINLDNELNPQYCGGLSISWSVNNIQFVKEANGDVYTYVLTADTSKEFRIIKGGIGGGNSEGYGYGPTGEYTSSIFDSTSSTSSYYTFTVNGAIPANTTMKFQLRSSNDAQMSGATWVGPDGTSSTYFQGISAFSIPTSLSNNRYFQYKTYFTSSDTVSTAYLSSIELSYQK